METAPRSRCSSSRTIRPDRPTGIGSGYPVAFTVEDLQGFVDGSSKQDGVRWRSSRRPATVGGHDYKIAFVIDPGGTASSSSGAFP